MSGKTVEQKFRKLSEVEHVLARPGRYIGSISPHTSDEYVVDASGKKFTIRQLTTNAGFLKIFDEVITNSVDHSRRPEGAHLNTIRVTVGENGEISVMDNGGIPVVKHAEYDQWVPEMIFELRSGSNFDDDSEDMVAGQNGEGASLTAIFSKEFIVETCDGKHRYRSVWTNNTADRGEPKIKPVAEGSKGYTNISYVPDFAALKMTDDMKADCYETIKRRTYEVAGANPHLKVYYNGERIHINSFKDFVSLYLPDDAEVAVDETEFWKVGVAHSDEGFKQISFVNTSATKEGGSHIMYVGMQIWEQIRAFIKKKHKVDIKPSDLRQHMTLFIDARMINPRYNSQTKDFLITEPKDYGTKWEVNDKFINRILKSSIIQSILDWAEAKERQAELAEARKKNKDVAKSNLRSIAKFTDATQKEKRDECCLFLVEGDSAGNAVLSARTSTIGCYPLRGKFPNAMNHSLADMLNNKEFVEFMAIMGLQVGEKVKDISQLRFGRIVACTDADHDGQHIFGLLTAMIKVYWPELLEMGCFYKFRTPIMKVIINKKEEKYFYSLSEFEEWREKNQNVKFVSRYLKGLGTSSAKDFATYFQNMDKHLTQIVVSDDSDMDIIDLVFGKEVGSSDARKEWLKLAEDA